jgi:hypothetical protein
MVKRKAVKSATREVSVRTLLTRELFRKLQRRAAREQRTISTMVKMILEEVLEDE